MLRWEPVLLNRLRKRGSAEGHAAARRPEQRARCICVADPSTMHTHRPGAAPNTLLLRCARSSVLLVMADQERGNFAVDTAAVREAREEGHEGGRRI